jgi:hypothetical protein
MTGVHFSNGPQLTCEGAIYSNGIANELATSPHVNRLKHDVGTIGQQTGLLITPNRLVISYPATDLTGTD